MGKMGVKKAKLNNAGMTLVEILVAIAILSVAIIPLMFAFVNSMRYNARGRELQQTTVLAHTIIENCKADSMQDVIKDLDNGTFLSGVSGLDLSDLDLDGDSIVEPEELPSPYTFYIQNVSLENQKYDVALSFASHEINGADSYDVLRSVSMNPYMDAMLTVHTKDDPLAADPMTPAAMDGEAYVKALEHIALGIKTASQTEPKLQPSGVTIDLTTDYINKSFKETSGTHYGMLNMKRTTSIYINRDVNGVETVTVKCAYSYEVTGGNYTYIFNDPNIYNDPVLGADVPLTFAAGGDIATYTYEIYSNSNTKDKGAFLENIYIMYYPAYSKDVTTSMYPFYSVDAMSFPVAEEFVVYNNMPNGRTINLYLVKQKNSNYVDSTAVHNMEVDYAGKVKVTGNSSAGATTNLYHNFDYDLGEDAAMSSWSVPGNWSGVDVKSSMISKESKRLMYDFVVQIYKSGAIVMNSGTPSIGSNAQLILTMDGTDLDW